MATFIDGIQTDATASSVAGSGNLTFKPANTLAGTWFSSGGFAIGTAGTDPGAGNAVFGDGQPTTIYWSISGTNRVLATVDAAGKTTFANSTFNTLINANASITFTPAGVAAAAVTGTGVALSTGTVGVFTGPYTDNSGTPGNSTTNKMSGRNAFAVGAQTVVVTNSIPTSATSHICIPTLVDADATGVKITAIVANGSITFTSRAIGGAATNCAAATKFDWVLIGTN